MHFKLSVQFSKRVFGIRVKIPKGMVEIKKNMFVSEHKEKRNFTIAMVNFTAQSYKQKKVKKIAVITGSSKGIGKSIAERFAANSYDLFLCARHENELKETAETLQKAHPRIDVAYKIADLSKKEDIISFANWCLAKSTPTVLVNNAGSYLPGNTFDEPDGQLETVMNINFYSAYYLTRALLPAMLKNKAGHIFNMCSIASLHAYKGGGSYSISKFALNGFTKNLRLEMMGQGIKVTAIYPGAVYTDTWGDFDNSDARIMEAADIAKMVFAASKLSPQANVDEIVIRPLQGDL